MHFQGAHGLVASRPHRLRCKSPATAATISRRATVFPAKHARSKMPRACFPLELNLFYKGILLLVRSAEGSRFVVIGPESE